MRSGVPLAEGAHQQEQYGRRSERTRSKGAVQMRSARRQKAGVVPVGSTPMGLVHTVGATSRCRGASFDRQDKVWPCEGACCALRLGVPPGAQTPAQCAQGGARMYRLWTVCAVTACGPRRHGARRAHGLRAYHAPAAAKKTSILSPFGGGYIVVVGGVGLADSFTIDMDSNSQVPHGTSMYQTFKESGTGPGNFDTYLRISDNSAVVWGYNNDADTHENYRSGRRELDPRHFAHRRPQV